MADGCLIEEVSRESGASFFCMWCYDLNLVTTIMIIYGVELSMNCCRNRESDSSYEDQ